MKFYPPIISLLLVGSAIANPFQNGSFETNNFDVGTFVEVTELDVLPGETSDSDYNGISATGWNLGNAGLNFNDSSSDGLYAAALSLNDSISQTFSFAQSGLHTISYDVWVNREATENSGDVGYNVTVRDVIADDKLLSRDNIKSYGRGYISLSYDIDVQQAGSHEVIFTNTNTASPGQGPQRLFVDNVKIESVPEPSSSMLLLLGSTSLLLRRKRG